MMTSQRLDRPGPEIPTRSIPRDTVLMTSEQIDTTAIMTQLVIARFAAGIALKHERMINVLMLAAYMHS